MTSRKKEIHCNSILPVVSFWPISQQDYKWNFLLVFLKVLVFQTKWIGVVTLLYKWNEMLDGIYIGLYTNVWIDWRTYEGKIALGQYMTH